MRKCEYSGKICRVEEVVRSINPKTANVLAEKFCLGSKEMCNQYKEIEDKGIGFYYYIINFLESAYTLYEKIRKK